MAAEGTACLPEEGQKAFNPVKAPRQAALDALRGWAILGMALSGLLPWGSLPPWMYHAQLPPPAMKFDPSVSGITWVDLVFPLFLFAMGAAIPFAMGRRLDQGEKWHETLEGLVRRFLLLLFFAFLVQETRPSSLANPGEWSSQGLGLGFFIGILLLFLAHPSLTKAWLVVIRLSGLLLLALLAWPMIQADQLSLLNQDIIIRVLAAVSLTGGLIFWGSRWWRHLPLAAFVLALIWFGLAKTTPFVAGTLEWTVHPVFTRLDYQKYLLVVIPGLWYGAWLLRTASEEDAAKPDQSRAWALGLTALIPLTLWLAGGTWQMSGAVLAVTAGALLWLSTKGKDQRSLVLMIACSLLAAGLTLSFLGEGIQKDSATVSYFLATSGLSILFHQGLEAWRTFSGSRGPGFVALAGSNPLLGYVLITHFIFSAVRLTGVHGWVGGQGWTPWGLAGYALLQTLIIGLIAAAAAKMKFTLRA